MPDIKKSVGKGSSNDVHDVALVQAMLRVVQDAKGKAYLPVDYDGTFGTQTNAAIESFQLGQQLVTQPSSLGQPGAMPTAAPTSGQEKLGTVTPNGPTIQRLNALLPAAFAAMRVIEGTSTVYLEGSAADASHSRTAIAGDLEFESMFRHKLTELVQKMYEKHGVVLWITPTGRRRTFAQQAAETQTRAGPGESNHNFGRASDIGFRGLRWVRPNGDIVNDADWLNALEATRPKDAGRFWDARDVLAAQLGLHRLKFERVHLQAFDQASISNARSLVALLNAVGSMQWKTGYQCDLGSKGKQWATVGTARQIWAGTATVLPGDLAKALTAASGKAVKASDIKQPELTAMRKALKADFEAADANWLKWAAVS